ncbi:MAG: hypothetical protein FJY81_00100 [Candidatus Aminicenantes bacterium]|nr:hypothetical protein [Candidatus Aminicenantes bacterium]
MGLSSSTMMKDAPKTAAQFKAIVRNGFYDGKDFYRIVRGPALP